MTVRVSTDSRGCVMVEIDRPPANAFDRRLLEEFEEVLADLSTDNGVKLVIIKGNARFFSAGADIGMLAQSTSASDMALFAARMQTTFRRLAMGPFVSIAAVEGTATGGGLELALSCDLRVFGANARCGLPEIKLGLIPAAGGTQKLSEICGRSIAARLILTGELIGADEAFRIGVAQYLCPAEAFDETIERLALQVSALPSAALAANKRCLALSRGADGYLEEILGTEVLHKDCDTRTLIANFVETRAARSSSAASTDHQIFVQEQ